MATIAATQVISSMPYNATRTALTSGADSLSYVGNGQELHFYNTTAAGVTAVLIGTLSTTISPIGYGGTISVAAGKSITVPASGHTVIPLDSIAAFLQGVVTITGGLGLVAVLLNNV